jgi:hypothetical protein
MLPVVLACYEFWFVADRSWKRVVPFFAASLVFGLQGLLLNPNTDNDYTFRFTLAAFWKSLSFYASRILLIPYAGFGLIALPLLVRDRRLWFGAAMMALFFVPLLFLPGRLFAAYCYLPLAGFALMAATVASIPQFTPVVAILCIVWVPLNISQLRKNRRDALAADADVRAYVSALQNFRQTSKAPRVFLYDALPPNFNWWGVDGTLRFLYGYPGPELHAASNARPPGSGLPGDTVLLKWDPGGHKLAVCGAANPGCSRLSGGLR